MRALITILDNTTETSMPFNEFVLYRANHYPDERQILIVCGPKGQLPQVKIPESLEIRYAGRSFPRIRKTVRNVIAALEKENIPYAIHLHQVQSAFLAETAMLGTGFRRKALFTVHNTFSGYELHNKILSFLNALPAQRITCVSNTAFRAYPKLIRRMKGERIQPLQNGVDTERIDEILSDSRPEPHEHTVFVYVARFVPVKNHQFLVDVLSRCGADVRFVFIGAEDPEKAVRKKAQELGVADRITITGLIPRREVFRRLQSADYYISSSTLEGLPVSVLEAMYCGLPCVLSDIPQHREAAGEEAVYLPLDADRWAAELNALAMLPAGERSARSERIRRYALEHFSLQAMHKKYDAVYERLL